jgi:hypothetical protein
MSHRSFRDKQGRQWEAWEVVPTAVERRMARDGNLPGEVRQERRRVQETRVLVPKHLQHGWLAFQCGSERRRLTPIPTDWFDMPDPSLADLLEQARQRPKGRKKPD